MKSKNADRLAVLRMMLSEIKYAQAQTNLHTNLSDGEVVKVLNSYQKKLEKSLSDFPDGAAREKVQSEIRIVAEYLPKKVGESETLQAIESVLNSTPERNFGALMKAVMSQLGPGADGKLVSQMLKAKMG